MERLTALTRRALFVTGHFLLGLLIRYWFGIAIEGRHRLPQQGPCLLAANHNSHLDTAIMFFLLGKNRHALQALAARDHFFGNRFIHFLVTSIFHALPVDRHRFSPDALLNTGRAVMQQGGMLLIYPEGGRGDGSEIRRFKPGVGYLALHLGAPVVPIYISGSAQAYPKGAFWPRPVNVLVRIGEALQPEPLTDDVATGVQIKRFTQQLERAVRELATAVHAPWALVTGASSGAGDAICDELAKRGFNLLITARRDEELQRVALRCRENYKVEVVVQACDIATEAGRSQLLARLSECGELRLLVNNAGMGAHGATAHPDAARHQALLALNVNAPVALTDAILPGMLARGTGMILNMGSVYSVVPAPGQGIYSGSKAFIRNWSRALQCELHGSGVSLTLALPGSFESGFHLGMGVREGRKLIKLPASRVAAVVVADTIRCRSTSVPGFLNWVFLAVCTVLPQRITAWIMQGLNALRGLKREQH